jgi:hypothetical protein
MAACSTARRVRRLWEGFSLVLLLTGSEDRYFDGTTGSPVGLHTDKLPCDSTIRCLPISAQGAFGQKMLLFALTIGIDYSTLGRKFRWEVE